MLGCRLLPRPRRLRLPACPASVPRPPLSHCTLPALLTAVLRCAALHAGPAVQVAAGLGAAWVAGRVLYTLGYSKGDPQGRLPGAAASGLVYLALLLSTLVVGVRTALP